MKQAIRNGSFSLMAALVLTGCGGGGSSSGSGSPANITTIYAGHWAGPWSDATGDAGVLDVTVGADGQFSGSIVNQTQGGVIGSAAGHVDGNGHLTGNYAYSGGIGVVVSGTVAVDQSGKLAGNVKEVQNGQPFSNGSFSLMRQ